VLGQLLGELTTSFVLNSRATANAILTSAIDKVIDFIAYNQLSLTQPSNKEKF
jgi:hypothetical protein